MEQAITGSAYETSSYRRSNSRSPVHARSRSPIRRPVSPRRYPSRSPPRRRYPSRSRSPRRDYRQARDNRDSRDYRDYRDSRDSRDYRDSRDSRQFERRLPRERRPVNRGSEEERAASKTLFVGNLPFFFEEREVCHLMERFGPVRKITIPQERFARKNRGFCFVEFEERRDAEDAMKKYQGFSVEGRELRIDWDVGSDRKFTPREDLPPRDYKYPSRVRDPASPADRSPIRSRSLSRSPIRPEDY